MKEGVQKISGLANIAKVLLITWMSLAGVSISLFAVALLTSNDLELYASISSWGAMVYLLSVVLFIITGIVFFVWLGKATNNAASISKNDKKFSVAWNIFAYVIPFINFVAPYSSMKQIWEVTSNDHKEIKNINVWWAFFLGYAFITRAADRVDDPMLDYITIEASLLYLIGISSGLVSAFFLIRTMKMISKGQEKHEK
jgi:hypothetical protein